MTTLIKSANLSKSFRFPSQRKPLKSFWKASTKRFWREEFLARLSILHSRCPEEHFGPQKIEKVFNILIFPKFEQKKLAVWAKKKCFGRIVNTPLFVSRGQLWYKNSTKNKFFSDSEQTFCFMVSETAVYLYRWAICVSIKTVNIFFPNWQSSKNQAPQKNSFLS